jgi:polysaccharide biosynthesis/export protein
VSRSPVTFRSAAALLLAGLAAGCAAQHSGDATADPPPALVADQYLIGAGDVLQVFVWRNPELSTTVPVRPDGKISTPLVDNMTAVGKTPTQLGTDMESVLGRYVRAPKVNIIVTQPVSNLSRVMVVGQVGHPQSVAYREGMKVLDALLAAGGLGPFAAGNRAKIVRNENGKRAELPVKLVKLTENGDLRQNVEMKPGDVLVVPRARF